MQNSLQIPKRCSITCFSLVDHALLHKSARRWCIYYKFLDDQTRQCEKYHRNCCGRHGYIWKFIPKRCETEQYDRLTVSIDFGFYIFWKLYVINDRRESDREHLRGFWETVFFCFFFVLFLFVHCAQLKWQWFFSILWFRHFPCFSKFDWVIIGICA